MSIIRNAALGVGGASEIDVAAASNDSSEFRLSPVGRQERYRLNERDLALAYSIISTHWGISPDDLVGDLGTAA